MKWECNHNCGRTISDAFYQYMIRRAGHPPLCVCRYALSGNPWSRWRRAHEASAQCWCEPEKEYVDPITGVTVYAHRRVH